MENLAAARRWAKAKEAANIAAEVSSSSISTEPRADPGTTIRNKLSYIFFQRERIRSAKNEN